MNFEISTAAHKLTLGVVLIWAGDWRIKAAGFSSRSDTVCYLSYRAAADEAGPEKLFDLSEATVKMRWQTGALDMHEAIARLNTEGEKSLILVRR
jgi:hypothetical protein